MVASFHSTNFPFIQILPVPGNPPIHLLLSAILAHLARELQERAGTRLALLSLAAEWTAVGTRVERLSAVPAEARLRSLAGPEAALNVLCVLGRAVDRRRGRCGPSSEAGA